MKPLKIGDRAEEEFLLAAAWYEEQRSGLGEDFLRAVRKCLSEIPASVQACAQVANLHTTPPVRKKRVKRYPYRVYFVELPDHLFVVSVAHDRRRPLYWKDWLPD